MSKINQANQKITDTIISSLENNVVPWRKSFATPIAARNGATGHIYRGINALMTNLSGYNSPYWMTRNQIKKAGGTWSGKGTPIVYVGRSLSENSEGDISEYTFLKYYFIWNGEQIKNVDFSKMEEKNFSEIREDIEPNEEAEKVIKNYPGRPKLVINEDPDQPRYTPARDTVTMTAARNFETDNSYYHTFFHELTHSTGHKNRLNRLDESTMMTRDSYSKEELIAELGACFLSNHCGLDPEIENSTAYIKGWLRALRNNPAWIVSAAAQAQKSTDYILNVKP